MQQRSSSSSALDVDKLEQEEEEKAERSVERAVFSGGSSSNSSSSDSDSSSSGGGLGQLVQAEVKEAEAKAIEEIDAEHMVPGQSTFYPRAFPVFLYPIIVRRGRRTIYGVDFLPVPPLTISTLSKNPHKLSDNFGASSCSCR